ncbi:hypothetical protein, partial [Pseudomonas aeruginosa]|uniref:hypothetical protein n=1 Tax=Pseudomonas aeruginosa TaxID=287 RepID=UPI002B40128A
MKRDSGATCHIMNDGIDEGDIIEQICLPYNEFWDAVILYQITFVLERFVFIKSLEAKFKPKTKQQIQSDSVYYTFNESDRKIDFYRNSIDTVRAKVKAFNNKSKGAFFEYHG